MSLQRVPAPGGEGGEGGDPFDSGFMALQPLSPRSSSRAASAAASASAATASSPPRTSSPLHAMPVRFPVLRKGAMVNLGDTGAAIHGIRSGEHVYNRRKPKPEERFLMTANGQHMEVSYYGDLNVRFHSDAGGEDVISTLLDLAVCDGLMYNLISFSLLQKQQSILLDESGALLHGNGIHFTLLGNGNYVQGTRVPPDDPGSPPAIAAAVIKPGRQRSMNINDMHQALGHKNEEVIRATAQQLGNKVTSLLDFCAARRRSRSLLLVPFPPTVSPHGRSIVLPSTLRAVSPRLPVERLS